MSSAGPRCCRLHTGGCGCGVIAVGAAVYLHNLTTILTDQSTAKPGKLNYFIADQPPTVHDLLLQKSDGTFQLVVWNERLKGADTVTVRLGGTHSAVKVYDPTIGTEAVQTLSKVNSLSRPKATRPILRTCPLFGIAKGSAESRRWAGQALC